MVKNIIPCILSCILLSFAAGCSQDLEVPVDFTVRLSDENTFKPGESVKFEIDGNVDNIVFYSGELGHNYEYKDRYEYDTSDVESITLDINYGIWYDEHQKPEDPTQLETYICTSWDSDQITWSDFEADSTAFMKMLEGGMEGWEKLYYVDEPEKDHTYVPYSYKLDPKYSEGLVIAFHYKPRETFDNSVWRRFYNIYGLLTTNFEKGTPFTLNLFSMSWQTFMMNTIPEARYDYVRDQCSVRIATSGVYTIRFDARRYYSDLRYPLPEAWAICKPIKMNKANPDTGESIKNLQNVLREYRYVYDEPGTYKAVFVGTNRNYKSSSRQVHEIEFTIE